MTAVFPMVEKAVKQIVENAISDAAGHVGGDLSYDESDDFYVWIGLVPGGSTDQINGTWIVDIDILSTSYSMSMSKSLELEAGIVGIRHSTDLMMIDQITQNQAPTERPWDDENVYRVGATYVLTGRRSG